MVDEYSFEAVDVAGQAEEVGRLLKSSLKSKDALLKALKQCGSLLGEARQSSEEHREALAGITAALGKRDILGHKDKDVKLRAAYCLCHVLRIHAPESPYSQEVLQDVFGLFLHVFRRLENPAAPSFQLCLSVLDCVSQTKCCLLALDFGTDGTVCDIFELVLDVINDDNAKAVEASTLELLGTLLEEGDEVSPQLLRIILDRLLAPQRDERPAAYRVAAELLRRCHSQLGPGIQKLLTTMMDGDGADKDLDCSYGELLVQVYQASPQTMLPVMPHLLAELTAREDARRATALGTVGALFALPDSDAERALPELFREFVRRSLDQKPEVRQRMLTLSAGVLLGPCSGSAKDQVLKAAMERLLDYDDKVRSAAVALICEVAVQDLRVVSQKALEAVSERLRDTKKSVRRDTAAHLLAVFRAACTRLHEGAEVAPEEELVIWVPARLLLCASKDADLAQHLTETLLRPGLLPAKVPLATAARQWAAIYMSSTAQEQRVLMAAVKARTTLQQAMRVYLELRAAKGEAAEAAAEARWPQVLRYIAAAFPLAAAKAEESLLKLKDLRDNNIFKSLAELATTTTSLEDSAKLAKDVVQRVGSKGPLAEFARGLCSRLAPQLISAQHVAELLQAAGAQSEKPLDEPFLAGMLKLLVDTSVAAPALFTGLFAKVLALLDDEDAGLAEAAAQILAHAGPAMRSDIASTDGVLAKAKRRLLSLCKEGSPKAAKAAVRALAALLPPREHTALLSTLCADLVECLDLEEAGAMERLPSVMQALSSIGRVAPSIFAEHAATIADFVLQSLLPLERADTEAEESGRTSSSWGLFSPSISLKAASLKALAHACVPDSVPASQGTWELPAEVEQVVDALCPQLCNLIEPTNEMEDLSPADMAKMRLASSEALLRLARMHDSRIHPEVYLPLALAMQDPVMEVRAGFGLKVRKTVLLLNSTPGMVQRASKYAAMLPLAGMDPNEPNRCAAYASLVEYVILRRRAAAKGVAAAAQAGGAGGTVLQELPEFMLPFVIQILAHHPDFPTRADVAEMGLSAYQPFARMLQFALEPLILASSSEPPGATLPAIAKVLRVLKHTEDATAEPATQNCHLLCDMGMALARAIVAQHSPAGASSEVGQFPGNVLLPRYLFRQLDTQLLRRAKPKEGDHLPPGFEVVLEQLCPNQIAPPGTAPKRAGPHGRTKQRGQDQQALQQELQPKEPKGAAKRSRKKPVRAETAQRVGRPKRRAASRPSIIETSDREDARESSQADEEDASGAESEEEHTPVRSKRPAAAAPQTARDMPGSSSGKRRAAVALEGSDSGGKRRKGGASPDENAQPANGGLPQQQQRVFSKPAGTKAANRNKPSDSANHADDVLEDLAAAEPDQAHAEQPSQESDWAVEAVDAKRSKPAVKAGSPAAGRKPARSRASRIAAAVKGAMARSAEKEAPPGEHATGQPAAPQTDSHGGAVSPAAEAMGAQQPTEMDRPASGGWRTRNGGGRAAAAGKAGAGQQGLAGTTMNGQQKSAAGDPPAADAAQTVRESLQPAAGDDLLRANTSDEDDDEDDAGDGGMSTELPNGLGAKTSAEDEIPEKEEAAARPTKRSRKGAREKPKAPAVKRRQPKRK